MADAIHLLMLEDNALDAELALTVLRQGGLVVECRCAVTRREFEAALAEGGWHLVLSDYALPGYTGLEALAAVRSRDSLLPFVLISGTLGDERAIECLKAGATDYVLKDNLQRLVPVVRRALSEHLERLALLEMQRALQRNEERYRAIVEDQSDLICRLSPDGIVTFVNHAMTRFLGRRSVDLIGARLLTFVAPEDASIASGAQSRISPQSPLVTCEYRIIDASGRHRWHQWVLRGLFAEAGQLSEIQAVGRDVTELVEALRALRESEARFGRAVRGSTDGLWDWDLVRQQIYYSPRFRALAGWRSEPRRADPPLFGDLLHPDDAEQVNRAIQENLVGGALFNQELRLRHEDGTYRWFLARGDTERGSDGKALNFSGSIADVSERRQFEESLRVAHLRLQRLSRRAMEVLESERRYLARELHDEIGQVLTAVKINLESVARQVDDDTLKERLSDSIDIANTALNQVRQLSLDLRPAQLDDLGLVAALRGHLDRQAAVGQLTAHFSAPERRVRLKPEVETACFRVAQEALTNVLRHGRARNVWLDLAINNGFVHLSLRDDGIGFELHGAGDRAAAGESLGLLSMQERVGLVGGQLSVEASPGLGTLIRASIPIGVEIRRSVREGVGRA
jgi:PAS domain S-box-containing protein